MNNIISLQKEIIENFDLFDEWEDKYEYLMDFSNGLQPLSDALKIDENLVEGCQSKVWIVENIENELVYFQTDSDAPIPKGLAAVVSKILSNNSVQDILKAEINFHKETDLILYLSPARAKGLESMIYRFKKLASKHLTNSVNV